MADSGGEVLWEGQPAPSPPASGSGERCKLPQGSVAEPRPPKGFHAFCAARLPLLASPGTSLYVLHTVCMGIRRCSALEADAAMRYINPRLTLTLTLTLEQTSKLSVKLPVAVGAMNIHDVRDRRQTDVRRQTA